MTGRTHAFFIAETINERESNHPGVSREALVMITLAGVSVYRTWVLLGSQPGAEAEAHDEAFGRFAARLARTLEH